MFGWNFETKIEKPNQQIDIEFDELRSIIANQGIRTVFQPIVSLTDASVIGYEALSRGPEESSLEMPDRLFRTARKYNLLGELEYLCRDKALEKTREMDNDKMVFINVDPQCIDEPGFKKGLTQEMLKEKGLKTTNVIFEISEKTAIEDYKKFDKVLENYISQGYKIAIDDTGSGYSGLKLLAQIYPHYIKVDMELVRNIDKDGLKQAMMRALYEFSLTTNSKIIAEGIESENELITLINIGIPLGQGYLLQRPAAGFLDISPVVRQLILREAAQKKREIFHTPLTIPIGEIARQDICFSPNIQGYKALEYFEANSIVQGLVVVDNERPVGLLMKNKFLSGLATQYGVAVYMNRPISLLMERKPLIVDYDTPLEQVSKLALSRTDESIYDYILITKNTKYWGITTIKRLLEKTSQLELNRAKHSNPLTGLPGNVVIEEKIKQVIQENSEFAVLYFDIDNFKPYNDIYGFENGDKVLSATATLINKILHENNPQGFLGHIGGDDFIAIIKNIDVTVLCQLFIDCFDARIKDFYTEEDKKRGHIISCNRHGVKEEFPLASLSIAVVTNKNQIFRTPEAIGEAAGIAKKKCKMIWRSCFEIV